MWALVLSVMQAQITAVSVTDTIKKTTSAFTIKTPTAGEFVSQCQEERTAREVPSSGLERSRR
jgi:hypothetical protein